MMRNFDGLKKEIGKHNYNQREKENINKIEYWISNVFDYTASVLEYAQFNDAKQDWTINQKNYDTFCCLYELYNHLTFTLMAYLSDQGKSFYEQSDYNNIMLEIHKERIGEDSYVQSIPTKSSMDAITKAFCTISSLNEGEKKHKIEIVPIATDPCIKNVEDVYYETSDVARYFEPSIPCIATGLSSAQYSKDGNYNTNEIIEKIENNIKEYGKCALVLDTTIQLPKNDPASKIINDKSIKKLVNEGKLIIFLAKSFQKFATLGTQKMKAGDLTIIGNKDCELVKSCMETLNSEFDDVFESSKSEFQWMTHLLKYNEKDEIEYLKKCMEGADIVKGIISQMNPLESVGMLLIDEGKHKLLSHRGYAGSYSIPTEMLSFGFSFCTASDYPNSKTRFTIGLEPKVLLEQLAGNKFSEPSIVWRPTNNNLSTHMSTYIEFIPQATEYLKKFCKDDGNMWEKAREIFLKQIIKNIKADINIFSDLQKLSEIFQNEEPKIQALKEKMNDIESEIYSKKKAIEKEYKESDPENIPTCFKYENFCNYYKIKEDPKDISTLKSVLENLKKITYSDESEYDNTYEERVEDIENAIDMIDNAKTDLKEFNETINNILKNSPINTERNQQIYKDLKKKADEICDMEKEIELLDEQTSDENRMKIALNDEKLKDPRSYLVLENLRYINSIKDYKSKRIEGYEAMLNTISNYNHKELIPLKEILEQVCKQ